MIGFSIALFCAMMIYAAIGYGLGTFFPWFVIHFFPVAIPFIVGAYIKEFFDEKKSQLPIARALRVAVIVWFAYIWVEVCTALDKFYKTGKFPNDGAPTMPFWDTMGYVAAVLIVTFAAYGLIGYLYTRYKFIKRAREREKEEISYRKRQEQLFLEKARAYKAQAGSNSYS